MSVVGFDFGSESCVVAVATQQGINVVSNDESNWETPVIICFGDKQRFIGTANAASDMSSPQNTITQIKTLIGRQYSDLYLQKRLKSMPFLVTEGRDGFPLIPVKYLGKQRTFTPTQLLGMLFSHLKGLAEKHLSAQVSDCCIGIPVYFTDLQRRAVLDAATIAGLHPLQLIHETTASALDYGDKAILLRNDPVNIVIVDIGHSSTQVSIARLEKGQLTILAHSFDLSLGVRDFDKVLFQHFAAKFEVENNIDVFRSATACSRLRAACEKLRKDFTVFQEVPLNIEYLIKRKGVRACIKREEFEEIVLPVLEQVKQLLEKVLADAKLTIENIHTVEVLGSGCRIPAIVKFLTEFFGKQPTAMMDSRWRVAKGCALQGAILKHVYKAKEFQIIESFPFNISCSWKTSSVAVAETDSKEITVIPRGSVIPCLKALTLMAHQSGTLLVDLQYSDDSELQAPAKISSYAIGPFHICNHKRSKHKIRVQLNLHGIVSIKSAQNLQQEENLVPTADKTNSTEAKITSSSALPVSEMIYGGLSQADLQKAIMEEFDMALKDSEAKEMKDRLIAIDAYMYDMRFNLKKNYLNLITHLKKDVQKKED